MLRTFRRPLSLLVFVLLTGAGTAQALPVVEGPDGARPETSFAFFWDWVTSAFEKVGSFIDPDGNSAYPSPDDPVTNSGSSLDVGSFIDPDGNS